ncbi:Hypothetical predicted protein [Olea europaea subsp. europaea]|uniref:Uncharacterized protein n=1 Tax=Olea europaea subsp. europaea TaxID=158383 RepID=A0A8S0U4B3_OLEEU|nr:Hypothetical predicted protein [Olea europaea subsp. europaea]
MRTMRVREAVAMGRSQEPMKAEMMKVRTRWTMIVGIVTVIEFDEVGRGGHFPLPTCIELLLSCMCRPPFMHDQHSITTAPATDVDPEPRESDVREGDNDRDLFCAKSQDGGGHHPSPDDHDKEMGIDMQEGNVAGGGGMDPEPFVHDDNEEVCVGSWDDDNKEVPHVGARNIEQNPVASTNGMAERDDKFFVGKL